MTKTQSDFPRSRTSINHNSYTSSCAPKNVGVRGQLPTTTKQNYTRIKNQKIIVYYPSAKIYIGYDQLPNFHKTLEDERNNISVTREVCLTLFIWP